MSIRLWLDTKRWFSLVERETLLGKESREEFERSLLLEFTKDKKLQKEMLEGFTHYPPSLREMKVAQENYNDTLSEEDVESVVDKRMLTESPILKEYKLKKSGKNIIPDINSYHMEVNQTIRVRK
jgi:hypothetical protein